jgi:hypothetical protein
MKVFLETTDWGKASAINHVYFLSDSKDRMYAYINLEGRIDEVKTPYRFYTKGRTFKEIANVWDFKVEKDEVVEGFVKIVIGSKGEKYTITEVAGVLQCSCPGSKFRGKCRHIES